MRLKHAIDRYNTVITYILLSCICLILILQHIVTSDYSFSTITENFNKKNIITTSYTRLQKNDKIEGSFTAHSNHLGIVVVRFDTFNGQNTDRLLFRIKEKGSKEWYYQNTYDTEEFTGLQFYPFGFPLIEKSQNKTYLFEIISQIGDTHPSVALSQKEPVFQAKYNYPISKITADPIALTNFMIKKTWNGIMYYDLIFVSIIYSLPLVFYYFRHELSTYLIKPFISKMIRWQASLGILPDHLQKEIHDNITTKIVVLFFALLIDIFIIQQTYTILFAFLMLMWFIIIVKEQTSFPTLLLLIAFLFFISMITQLIGLDDIAEKASIWSFLLMIISTLYWIIRKPLKLQYI